MSRLRRSLSVSFSLPRVVPARLKGLAVARRVRRRPLPSQPPRRRPKPWRPRLQLRPQGQRLWRRRRRQSREPPLPHRHYQGRQHRSRHLFPSESRFRPGPPPDIQARSQPSVHTTPQACSAPSWCITSLDRRKPKGWERSGRMGRATSRGVGSLGQTPHGASGPSQSRAAQRALRATSTSSNRAESDHRSTGVGCGSG